jgi:predicted ester cyclase
VVEFTTTFSGLRFTIEDMISEKAKVAVSWIVSGTLPATGSKIFLEGITIHHITNGRILDSHARWDVLGLLRQLGDASPRTLTAASVS